MEEMRRVTTCGICIRDGKVLVGKRIKEGEIGGLWEFPGGKNRWHETVADTLKREWLEELGVHVTVGNALGTTDFVHKGTHFTLVACEVSFPEDEKPVLSVQTELKFVTLDELKGLAMAPSDQAIRSILLSEQSL